MKADSYSNESKFELKFTFFSPLDASHGDVLRVTKPCTSISKYSRLKCL